MHPGILTVIILSFILYTHAVAHAPSPPTLSSDGRAGIALQPTGSAANISGVCAFKTINYITHTLPQQCHRSASPTGSSPLLAATGTATTTSTTTVAKHVLNTAEVDINDLSSTMFLSFEEWKAAMLENHAPEPSREARDARDRNLEAGSPGSNGELDLNFDSLTDKMTEYTARDKAQLSTAEDRRKALAMGSRDESAVAPIVRSKDAGKTCKERFSYASFDAGATILKTSPGTKNAKAILVETKDTYMLMECSRHNKFLIVELSDDILVDTVVLANFEFFSSMIRHFRVSVSDRYPVKLEKWTVLGTFEARNSRDIQPFLVQNPAIWAKYLRIEFLTHYGNEYYCPMSLLRVHGTRMIDTWKETVAVDDDDVVVEETPGVVEQRAIEVNTAEPTAQPTDVCGTSDNQDSPSMLFAKAEPPECGICASITSIGHEIELPTTAQEKVIHIPNISQAAQVQSTSISMAAQAPLTLGSSTPGEIVTIIAQNPNGVSAAPLSSMSSVPVPSVTSVENLPLQIPPGIQSLLYSLGFSPSLLHSDTIRVANSSQSGSISGYESTSAPVCSSTPTQNPPGHTGATATPIPSSHVPSASSLSSASRTVTVSVVPVTQVTKSTPPLQSTTTAAGNNASNVPLATHRSKTWTSSPTTAHTAYPTVQESFFKAVNKRLNQLESNTNMSMQYIESQSRFLQQTLMSLERRQLLKIDALLDELNTTVLSELRALKQQYDQVWQSTVIALETAREQSADESVALGRRIQLLADEVVFQKRMAIAQATLCLVALGLAFFQSRLGVGGTAGSNSRYHLVTHST